MLRDAFLVQAMVFSVRVKVSSVFPARGTRKKKRRHKGPGSGWSWVPCAFDLQALGPVPQGALSASPGRPLVLLGKLFFCRKSTLQPAGCQNCLSDSSSLLRNCPSSLDLNALL